MEYAQADGAAAERAFKSPRRLFREVTSQFSEQQRQLETVNACNCILSACSTDTLVTDTHCVLYLLPCEHFTLLYSCHCTLACEITDKRRQDKVTPGLCMSLRWEAYLAGLGLYGDQDKVRRKP